MVRLGIDEAKELRRRAHVVRLAACYIEDEDNQRPYAESPPVEFLRKAATSWEALASLLEEGPR